MNLGTKCYVFLDLRNFGNRYAGTCVGKSAIGSYTQPAPRQRPLDARAPPDSQTKRGKLDPEMIEMVCSQQPPKHTVSQLLPRKCFTFSRPAFPCMRVFRRVLAALVIFIALLLVLPSLWFAVFVNPSVRKARAMLDTGAPESALALQVTLTLDGTRATFHRGDAAYATLLAVLRTTGSPEVMEAAGQDPASGERKSCGDLAIASYGLTSHFRLARSISNPHYLWIRLPHLNRGGYGLPVFIDDGRLAPLVQSAVSPNP